MNTFPPFLRVAAVQDVDEFRMLPGGRTHALLNTREASGLGGVNSIGKGGDLIMDAMRSGGAQFIFVNEVLGGEEDASAWVKAVTSGGTAGGRLTCTPVPGGVGG